MLSPIISLVTPCLNPLSLASFLSTALLKVTSDLLLSSGYGHLKIFIFLDLTAAVDTIHHTIFPSFLEHSLNITSAALSWLKSYLSDRQQFININNCTSSIAPLSPGVPQGWCLVSPSSSYICFHLVISLIIMISISTVMAMTASSTSPPILLPLKLTLH